MGRDSKPKHPWTKRTTTPSKGGVLPSLRDSKNSTRSFSVPRFALTCAHNVKSYQRQASSADNKHRRPLLHGVGVARKQEECCSCDSDGGGATSPHQVDTIAKGSSDAAAGFSQGSGRKVKNSGASDDYVVIDVKHESADAPSNDEGDRDDTDDDPLIFMLDDETDYHFV